MLRFLFILILCFTTCQPRSKNEPEIELSTQFKDYWYSGDAEITSYHLEQARYGELRKGEAVLIFVTEDFLPGEQVKAGNRNEDNISVLKLNAVKNFTTGIYPYNIMQSTFYPLNGETHALKISASIQEWCGQVYMQLNKRNTFRIQSHSYFEGEADENHEVKIVSLENEIWNKIRVEPHQLPTGDFEMIPSFEYLRLNHRPVKAYKVTGEYYNIEDLNVYQLTYPELHRKLKIYFSTAFPYTIEKWEESSPSGLRDNAPILTTRAVKKQRIKTDYWNKNSNKNLPLREKLDLE